MKKIHVMFLAFVCWSDQRVHVAATVQSNFSGLPLPGSITRYLATVPGEKWSWTVLAEKWKNKAPVKVLLLGGSLTAGTRWPKYFCDWVTNTFPRSKCLNGAVGGMGPHYLLSCLNTSCAVKMNLRKLSPDLVVVDQSMNPWSHSTGTATTLPGLKSAYPLQGFWLERIIRVLRGLPSEPTIVGVNFPRLRFDWSIVPQIPVQPFTLSLDDELSRIYRYYGLPVCSLRNGLWPLISMGKQSGKTWELFGRPFLVDGGHPNAPWEAKLYADLAVHCVAEGILRTSVDGIGENSRLPPLMTTQADIEFRFPNWIAHICSDKKRSLAWIGRPFKDLEHLCRPDFPEQRIGSLYAETVVGTTVHSAGNVTKRIEQMLLFSAGVGLLVWDSANPLTTQIRSLAVPPTPCSGLPWVRFYAHLHFAIMHFYQLQPEQLQVIYGFPSWARWGRYWVPFFFMLSGFVMYLSEGRGENESADVGSVMGKRLRNLYPTFLLGLSLALCGNPEARSLALEDPLALITTVSLTQVWVAPYGYALLNGPSWFLSVLLVCYMMLPRWLSQVKRLKRCDIAFVMLCMFGSVARNTAIWLFVCASGKPLAELNIGAFLDFSPFSNLHTFLMGLVLARIYCDNSTRLKALRVMRISGSSIMVGFSLFFSSVETPLNESLGRLVAETLFVPVFAILILSLACGSDILLGDDKWGHLLFSDTLPGVSWCIYILHVPLFFIVQHPLEINGFGQPEIALAFVTAICVAIYVLYDKPLKLILKKGCKRQEFKNIAAEESACPQEHDRVQFESAGLKSVCETA